MPITNVLIPLLVLMLIPLLELYQGANDQCFAKTLINFFRALGQMFDKLNSAEQVEGAESVVKVPQFCF